jgi:hypothetical protein
MHEPYGTKKVKQSVVLRTLFDYANLQNVGSYGKCSKLKARANA